MLPQFIVIMGFQFTGELVATTLQLTFPGPLCGLVLLLGWLSLNGGPSDDLDRAASILVDQLGLLFVPAGTAIIGFGTLLLTDGVAIAGALLFSTGLAILITGLLSGPKVAEPAQQPSE